MNRSLLMVVVLGSGLAFAQGSPVKKGASAKDTAPEAAAPAQEKKKAEPVRPPPPDVTRLPFTPDSIREVMQYHSRDVQECYEELLAMKGNKVEEGRIMTTFTISPDGFVRNAKVMFVRLQAAFDAADVADLREFTSPQMFGELRLEIDERGGARNVTDVISLEAQLLGVETVGDDYEASVRFTGMIREEDGTSGPAAALGLVGGLVLLLVLVNVGKEIGDRQRPETRFYDPRGLSYPSGHSAYVVAWLAVASLTGRRALIVAAVLVCIAVGASRLYLHVHYLTDVVGGIALGGQRPAGATGPGCRDGAGPAGRPGRPAGPRAAVAVGRRPHGAAAAAQDPPVGRLPG